jgi:hypothetical protein
MSANVRGRAMSKPKAPTIRRNIPSEMRAPLRSHATVIGELVWASNFSHGAFEILFSHVVNHTNFQMGRSVWHIATSDSGQLKMLVAATEASERLSVKMRANIMWAAGKALKLGELRNDAVHSATVVITTEKPAKIVPASIGTRPTRYEKLERMPDLKKQFRLVKGDLLQVGQYVHALWPHLAGFDLLPPLPRRPQLRSIQKGIWKKAVRRPMR